MDGGAWWATIHRVLEIWTFSEKLIGHSKKKMENFIQLEDYNLRTAPQKSPRTVLPIRSQKAIT